MRPLRLFLFLFVWCCSSHTIFAEMVSADIVIVGGTPAGISAAISARRVGTERVVIVEPFNHVGGRMSETLGFGEENRMVRSSLGGHWNELKERVNKKYGRETPSPEPHMMEEVFDQWLEEEGVLVLKSFQTVRVIKNKFHIQKLIARDGREVKASIFIDASYAGDLLPLAGVSWVIGRESRSQYNESLAGVVLKLKDPPGKIVEPIYRLPISGFEEDGKTLLPHVHGLTTDVVEGAGDQHLQCFNMYACFTSDLNRRIDLQKPVDYDPHEFEILRREVLHNKGKSTLTFGRGIPNHKGMINDGVPRLLHWGFAGAGDNYPTASVVKRKVIWQEHVNYTRRLIWFIQNDPCIIESQRKYFQTWGLSKDEFVDNGHWPRDVYIREGRRMVGDYVMTQVDVFEKTSKKDSIALGSFPVDSHVVQRLASPDGKEVVNEGGFLVETPVYQIPYRAFLPQSKECKNLLVPIAMSCSRVAFNSLRVEPTWMATGQASGVAGALAVKLKKDIQDVPVDSIQVILRKSGLPIDKE
ncbi:MAG: FAD-dependent oxidoreductase [Gimesia sp.]|nr:FAD-dependent oxidoreductase [Gimesia sp.]